jgi:hypothetical protein
MFPRSIRLLAATLSKVNKTILNFDKVSSANSEALVPLYVVDANASDFGCVGG